MKVTVVEVARPSMTSFTMFEKLDMNVVKESKVINFECSNHTKTRINTSFQVGQSRHKINWEVEGFKTFESREHSYFTGEYSTSHYFIKSKTQDLECYKRYITQLVLDLCKRYGIELDEIEVRLINRVF